MTRRTWPTARIGAVGLENSHVGHFVKHLNVEGRHPGFTVTALVGGDAEQSDRLRALGNGLVTHVVEDPAELIGHVDAAIICTRDGALHVKQALPLLEAGVPLLVDKPLATTVQEAQLMIDVAGQHDTVLMSRSAQRAAPELDPLQESSTVRGDTVCVNVIGPADPDSEYSGLTFYGIHEIEAALAITGDGTLGEVTVERVEGAVVAMTTVNGIAVVITFVVAEGEQDLGFHATVIGRRGVTHTRLSAEQRQHAVTLDLFIDMLRTGEPPTDYATMLRSIQLLEAVTSQL
ncbi:Gfo/Idh/MocA family protein [Microlunatus sp. Y2014]|uniref:Gfo/Idh/MocA family protein n=1 Tax=Microlunatus sp. Y2014 TaxID=3418488 RepID=UPI003DA76131